MVLQMALIRGNMGLHNMQTHIIISALCYA